MIHDQRNCQNEEISAKFLRLVCNLTKKEPFGKANQGPNALKGQTSVDDAWVRE